ncbi:unnamed protein product [Pleuronectes platessa]|uniref:Uncharacterized protein n=1 Tax=Pleuronectes platessa TaxID=8262 RepID=A0A9N7UGR1_PLEPL|nr:unnamed protein product [Pleuronectes platessa]
MKLEMFVALKTLVNTISHQNLCKLLSSCARCVTVDVSSRGLEDKKLVNPSPLITEPISCCVYDALYDFGNVRSIPSLTFVTGVSRRHWGSQHALCFTLELIAGCHLRSCLFPFSCQDH